MPATVVRIESRLGQYSLLKLAMPGAPEHTIGVFLLDPASGRLYLRLRDRFDDLAAPEDLEYLSLLEGDLRSRADELGGEPFVASLEDSLSQLLRISDRQAISVHSFEHTLDRLFARHVEKTAVIPFRTHLPLYSLRAAATRFGEDMQVEEEDWVRIPEGLRPSEDLFVAHVVGRSMEPRIPDGSLNIFRAPVVGSRQNKIVLVELLGQLDDSARYTIKKYTSRKVSAGEDEWSHESIRLEPLNPEFQAFELEPDRVRVIAEWIRTLD
jgi:SOS-response transcriptional repressor LexA